MKLYGKLLICLLLTITLAICAGHTWANPIEIMQALMGDNSLSARLLAQWRLPRVLTSALVGGLLGLSGAIFQGVFRNPLTEPWLLGASGGAAVGATIALLVPLAIPMAISLPLFSFVGAFATILLVLSIARLTGSLDVTTLLLTGVAISAMLSAIRSFLMMSLSNETISLQVVLSWLMGGIQTPSWTGLIIATGLFIMGLVIALRLAHGLDLLGLGENMATTMGLSVNRFILLALLVGSAITACAVALGGIIGFVGLAAPHIARWLSGSQHKRLLPQATIIGAILVTLADALARSLLSPGEIPLGVITAIAGTPLFIVLLARRNKR
ncbi:iron ABC transporter permease [Entomomonas sp. E2T0]|uniref:FecCD family ABC transporter permease n=1 Tax=Entomomonas sp. E2T0 TaxID=2930213 RepID=UPI0022281072|nr:iron ABC transporter permease [Entomomonas sp. E2T0]UYZ83394.1 iron ABC transporter permease [Entomomonas sp. E2T0]